MFNEIVLHNYAAPLASRKRTFTGPYRWKPATKSEGRGFYCQHDTREIRCADHGAGFDLRLESANEHLSSYSRLRHIDGYFCDNDGCGDTLQPIIARLPRGRGFLAGWTMGAGMCASIDFTIYEDATDAAMAAHDMAESDAEKQREANERDMAEYDDYEIGG